MVDIGGAFLVYIFWLLHGASKRKNFLKNQERATRHKVMVTIRSELAALSFARVLQLSRHIHSSPNSSQRRERESRASCSGMLLLLMLFLLKHCTFYLSYSFPRLLLWDTLSRHSAAICPKIVVPTDRWTHHTQVLYFYFVCWCKSCTTITVQLHNI